MIEVSPYAAADADAVERIVTAAYGRPISPSPRARAVTAHTFSFVARQAETIAGFVQLFDYDNAGYVATMAVDPALHRAGVGTALMRALLDHADRHGPGSLVLDATDMGAPLYERFGFGDIDRTVVYERVGHTAEQTADRETVGAWPDPRVLSLDRDICGCNRSHALAAFVQNEAAHVLHDDDGYAMIRGRVLGPWIARTPQAAKALFGEALETAPDLRRVCVPESNAEAPAMLHARGFEPDRSLRHMARGPSPFHRTLIYGQASLGHG